MLFKMLTDFVYRRLFGPSKTETPAGQRFFTFCGQLYDGRKYAKVLDPSDMPPGDFDPCRNKEIKQDRMVVEIGSPEYERLKDYKGWEC